jgi:hypothetical protein
LEEKSDDALLKILRVLESPGVVGDMFTSAAAYDPTFWPLHGAMERLISYKRAMISSGVIAASDFDESWAYPKWTVQALSTGAYLAGVCDWTAVTSVTDLALPVCSDPTSPDTNTDGHFCSGHNSYDVLPFSNFLDAGETYTNAQFYEFMHPWSDDLPYVYDSLDFNYCADHGEAFI